MKYGILVNAYIRNNSQISQVKRLVEEFKNRSIDCEVIKNINVAKILNSSIECPQLDCCIFLDKDKATARMFEKSGIRLFNSARAIELCDDKILTHIALSQNNIPMPDSIPSPLCYHAESDIILSFIDEVAQKLSFPLVAKKCYGSLGTGVSLIKNIDELKTYERENITKIHFYQKFIGKGGEDIRVIVIGGKYVCAMKRTNENDFRSNIELGGKGEKYYADDNLISLCERTANILNLDYCGIDVLTDEQGNRYICEVNSNAFFAAAERTSGVNIAKTYIEHILNKTSTL